MPKQPISEAMRTQVLNCFDRLNQKSDSSSKVTGVAVHKMYIELHPNNVLSLRKVQDIIKRAKEDSTEEKEEPLISPFEPGWPTDADDIAFLFFIDHQNQVGEGDDEVRYYPSKQIGQFQPIEYGSSPLIGSLYGSWVWTRSEIEWAKRLKTTVGWPDHMGGFWLDDEQRESLQYLLPELLPEDRYDYPIHSFSLLRWVINEFASRERYNARRDIEKVVFDDLYYLLAQRPWFSLTTMQKCFDWFQNGRVMPLIDTQSEPHLALLKLNNHQDAIHISQELENYWNNVIYWEGNHHPEAEWLDPDTNSFEWVKPEDHQLHDSEDEDGPSVSDLEAIRGEIQLLWEKIDGRLRTIHEYDSGMDTEGLEDWEDDFEDDFEDIRIAKLKEMMDTFLERLAPVIENGIRNNLCVIATEEVRDLSSLRV